MARKSAKDANYQFNAVAIEDSLSETTQEATVSEADITAFTDEYQNALVGKANIATSLTGSYDPATGKSILTLFAAIGSGPVTTVFQPGGDATGQYSCTASGLTGALVRDLTMRFPVGDKASFTAVIQHSGATTRA